MSMAISKSTATRMNDDDDDDNVPVVDDE